MVALLREQLQSPRDAVRVNPSKEPGGDPGGPRGCASTIVPSLIRGGNDRKCSAEAAHGAVIGIRLHGHRARAC